MHDVVWCCALPSCAVQPQMQLGQEQGLHCFLKTAKPGQHVVLAAKPSLCLKCAVQWCVTTACLTGVVVVALYVVHINYIQHSIYYVVRFGNATVSLPAMGQLQIVCTGDVQHAF